MMTDQEAGRLAEYLTVPDEVFPADVAIVFGMSAWRRPLERSLALRESGVVRQLLFTGGFNGKIGAVEADEMAREALLRGVPAADILIDPTSTNTAENVENSLLCLERAIGLDRISGVLLVAIEFHMRRARITAARRLPAHVRIGTCSYPSIHYAMAGWSSSEIGRRDVLSEIAKIREYLGEGPADP